LIGEDQNGHVSSLRALNKNIVGASTGRQDVHLIAVLAVEVQISVRLDLCRVNAPFGFSQRAVYRQSVVGDAEAAWGLVFPVGCGVSRIPGGRGLVRVIGRLARLKASVLATVDVAVGVIA
jgi:hypothetical protein